MKIRRSKKEVLEHERELAAQVDVDAASARQISLSEQAYLNAARYFEKNLAASEKAKAKWAIRLCYVFGAMTMASIIAVACMAPLKTVETYLVRVDNNSGYTEVVKPLSQVKSTEQIDDEYWLAAYVRFRESYNFSSNADVYHMVELLSHDDTFAEYKNFQLSSKGYLSVLGTNRQIRTEINNIDFLQRADGKGTAQVRITKTVLDHNGVPDPQLKPATWIATVTFDYKNPAKQAGDQWMNPHNFGVLAYTTTQVVGVSHEK